MAVGLPGQQPTFSNANLRTAPATGGLDASIRAAAAGQRGPLWIGYAVPAQSGTGESCCWNGSNHGCGLEDNRGSTVHSGGEKVPVKLEGPSHYSVLYRVEGGFVGRLAAYALDCPIDAGGLPVVWLTGVTPSESIATLARYAVSADQTKVANSAIFAIAMHAGAEADGALERIAAPTQPEKVRRDALFWLGMARGRRGYEVVSRVVREDPSDHVREHAIFVLSESKEPEAIPTIIRIAKEDKSAHVRGKALFWLAQKASKKAGAAISDSIANDPDTEVKKAAVFALTQLPNDGGVPALIQVARSNGNMNVRKQAMFWLGQSKDPRALQFIETVLAR
ncbi:MAG: HEAT repeat domain-containing protein [Bryobacteraceae bacterium]